MLNKSTLVAPCQSHRLHSVGRRLTDILHDPDGGVFVQNRCAESPLRQGSGQVFSAPLRYGSTYTPVEQLTESACLKCVEGGSEACSAQQFRHARVAVVISQSNAHRFTLGSAGCG